MWFSGYLLTVVGVAILSVLIHLVLPSGKITKNVLAAFSVFVLVVMLSPVIQFLKNADLVDAKYYLDENFLSKQDNLDGIQATLQSVLSTKFDGVKVRVSKTGQDIFVFVDLSKLVINNSQEHINYYTAVKELGKEQIDRDDERIVVYG